MNRGSLHTKYFRHTHLSVFRYRLTKNGFVGPKSFWGFRETELWCHYVAFEFLVDSLFTLMVFLHVLQVSSLLKYDLAKEPVLKPLRVDVASSLNQYCNFPMQKMFFESKKSYKFGLRTVKIPKK